MLEKITEKAQATPAPQLKLMPETTSYPKRLIEVDLPIKRISAHARREKSICHGHISTLHIWWLGDLWHRVGRLFVLLYGLTLLMICVRRSGTSDRTFKSAIIYAINLRFAYAIADSDAQLREEARKLLAWQI